jgi:glutathione S-transferase
LSAAAEQAAQKLFKAAEALLVPNREHLFETWCIADVDLALMLNRLVLNGDAVPAQLADYAKRQWERAAVQAWVKLPRPPL